MWLLHLKLTLSHVALNPSEEQTQSQKIKIRQNPQKQTNKNKTPKETLRQKLSSVLVKLKHTLGKKLGTLTDIRKNAIYLPVCIWRIIHFALKRISFFSPSPSDSASEKNVIVTISDAKEGMGNFARMSIARVAGSYILCWWSRPTFESRN